MRTPGLWLYKKVWMPFRLPPFSGDADPIMEPHFRTWMWWQIGTWFSAYAEVSFYVLMVFLSLWLFDALPVVYVKVQTTLLGLSMVGSGIGLFQCRRYHRQLMKQFDEAARQAAAAAMPPVVPGLRVIPGGQGKDLKN